MSVYVSVIIVHRRCLFQLVELRIHRTVLWRIPDVLAVIGGSDIFVRSVSDDDAGFDLPFLHRQGVWFPRAEVDKIVLGALVDVSNGFPSPFSDVTDYADNAQADRSQYCHQDDT